MRVAVVACLKFGCYWPALDVIIRRGRVRTISALIFFGVVEQLEAVKILQGFLHLDLATVFIAVEDVSTS